MPPKLKIRAAESSNSKRHSRRDGTRAKSEPEPEPRDRISDLPDALISHILSFLPTRQAISTSLLSRRWRTLWMSVPSLDLSSTDFEDPTMSTNKQVERFKLFVDSVLLSNDFQALERFRLDCNLWCNEWDLKRWLHDAIERCVRQLDVSCSVYVLVDLPSSLYTCETLVSLKLKGEGIRFVPPYFSPVHLPSLKILHVDSVVPDRLWDDEGSDPFARFLSGCPVLEDMRFGGFYRDEYDVDENNEIVFSLTICVPTLKSLSICCYGEVKSEFDRIEIKAPALESLDMGYVYCKEFLVEDFPNLMEAQLLCCHPFTGELLSALKNAKFLSLNDEPCRWEMMPLLLDFIPKFELLKHLEIDSFLFDVLSPLLENSPNLEALILVKDSGAYKMSWSAPPCVPRCLLNCLSTFQFSVFHGVPSELELEMLEYVMEHAQVLNRVTICLSLPDSDPEKLSIIKQLAEFPRGSKTCRLKFI